jgi:hypothetical protein
VENFESFADEILGFIGRLDDAIFNAVRAQMRNEGPDEAKALEKRLSKVRRRLRESETMLRENPEEAED